MQLIHNTNKENHLFFSNSVHEDKKVPSLHVIYLCKYICGLPIKESCYFTWMYTIKVRDKHWLPLCSCHQFWIWRNW